MTVNEMGERVMIVCFGFLIISAGLALLALAYAITFGGVQ